MLLKRGETENMCFSLIQWKLGMSTGAGQHAVSLSTDLSKKCTQAGSIWQQNNVLCDELFWFVKCMQ